MNLIIGEMGKYMLCGTGFQFYVIHLKYHFRNVQFEEKVNFINSSVLSNVLSTKTEATGNIRQNSKKNCALFSDRNFFDDKDQSKF